MRAKLDGIRDKTIRQLERVGIKMDITTPAGMFVWADASCDTTVLTEKAMNQGYLFAPGSLFSPNQLPSTKTRINVATMSDPGVWRFLEGELGKA